MAIFKTGAIIGAISGTVGGVNFANPRGSKVVRRARRASANKTQPQMLIQARMATLISLWRRKPIEEQDAWRAAASQNPYPNRLGQSRQISGFQFFLKENMPFEPNIIAGIAEEKKPLPPTSVSTQVIATTTFTSTVTSGIVVTFTDLQSPGGYGGGFFGRLLYRTTPIKFTNTYRSIGIASRAGNGTINLSTIWQTVFTLPVLGQFIAIQFKPDQNKFRRGAWTTVIIETTA